MDIGMAGQMTCWKGDVEMEIKTIYVYSGHLGFSGRGLLRYETRCS